MNDMTATIGHNLRDPLDSEIEHALTEFKSQFDERAGDIDSCRVTNEDEAGRATALAGILMDIADTAEKRRVELKDPYLKGGKKIDSAFKSFDEIVVAAKKRILAMINAYAREQDRKAEEAAAKAAQEAAEKEAQARAAAESGNFVQAAKLEQQADQAAARVEQATASAAQPIRSAYGQTASAKTVWRFEIIDKKKLPKAVTEHPKVKEAIDTVIGAFVRAGSRDIAGVRIWSEKDTMVRR